MDLLLGPRRRPRRNVLFWTAEPPKGVLMLLIQNSGLYKTSLWLIRRLGGGKVNWFQTIPESVASWEGEEREGREGKERKERKGRKGKERKGKEEGGPKVHPKWPRVAPTSARVNLTLF